MPGSRGNDVLLRDAGGMTPQQTVYSNARMRAEFGLGASGREAILRYPGAAAGGALRERLSAPYLIRVPRCDSGRALLAFTSPSEKLVCRSFTLGRLIRYLRANCEKLSRSRDTTCSSKVPAPLM